MAADLADVRGLFDAVIPATAADPRCSSASIDALAAIVEHVLAAQEAHKAADRPAAPAYRCENHGPSPVDSRPDPGRIPHVPPTYVRPVRLLVDVDNPRAVDVAGIQTAIYRQLGLQGLHRSRITRLPYRRQP